MSFLHPWAFLGLLSLPAIIALHWHFERQRRVIVSSMFLWRFLDEKFQGRKVSFLHLSWLLFLDLLIAILLTLALARPIVELPVLGTTEHQQIILLDDSGSMLAQDGASDRFASAKQIAAGIVRTAGPKTELAVLTFGGEVELIGATTGEDSNGLSGLVQQMSASGRGEDLRAALSIAASMADPQTPQLVTVITDGAFPLPPLDDYPFEIVWRFVGEGENNQAVLDLAIEGGSQASSAVFFRLANYSDAAVIREVEVAVDGKAVVTHTLNLPPDSIIPQTVSLTGVKESVIVSLLGVDDMPADDSASLGAEEASPVKVAVVADNPYPLDRAIETIPGTILKVFSPNLFLNDNTYDLVIYRGMVPSTWPRGTVLVFDPPPAQSVISVGTPVEVESQLQVDPGSILAGAGLESVRWEYLVAFGEIESSEVLAQTEEMPFILHHHTAESDVYLFAPLLDAGNFTKHPAFPILLSRFVSLSRDFLPQPAYLVGDILALPQGEIQIKAPSGELSIEEGVSALELTEPGLYQFEAVDNLGGRWEAAFGVNLGEEVESDIAPQGWRDQLAASQQESDRDWQLAEVDLSPWLLGIAILLLLVEAWRAWR